jgi:translocation and assembly module TamB
VDFSHSDAPSLGDDVEVIRRPAAAPAAATASRGRGIGRRRDVAGAGAGAAAEPAQGRPRPAGGDGRKASGPRPRPRCRAARRAAHQLARRQAERRRQPAGGERHLPGVRAEARIDRGELTFVGPIENPRLDIEATRPNLDVRVGVQVAGPGAQARGPPVLRARHVGHRQAELAAARPGQRDHRRRRHRAAAAAALALLAGEGTAPTEQITQAIGLDEISVRQQTEGDTKETIVKVGKQLSKDWYIGYERGLNATAGSWQLIYRLARQLTVRAQAGGDNSLDLIWTLRWK